MMTSYLWSWILIIQLFSIVPCYASVIQKRSIGIVARLAVQDIFIRNLTRDEKTKRAFMGLAIGLGVVLFVGLLGLFLYVRQQKMAEAAADPEAVPAVEKPSWWMVEGNEKKHWWSPSPKSSTPRYPEDGNRIERLKAALKIKSNREPLLPTHNRDTSSSVETLNLPIQPVPLVRPQYPEALERGYRAPVYPTQYVHPLPTFHRTTYDVGRPVKRNPALPSELAINPTASRSAAAARHERRTGIPRSPAHKRRTFLSRQHCRPHPFIHLKGSDTRLATISAPMPVDPSKLSHPKLAPVDLGQVPIDQRPRRSSMKGSKGQRPPPLALGEDNNLPRRVRFGVSSPKQTRV